MKTQTLRIDHTRPICVATPAGMIRILRGTDLRSIRIELPDGMTANRGEERAVAGNPFMVRDGDVLRPAYQFMLPVTDERGNLNGCRVQRLARIGE